MMVAITVFQVIAITMAMIITKMFNDNDADNNNLSNN